MKNFEELKNAYLEDLTINKNNALMAVRNDGFNLRSVKYQTEEICLEAVRCDGYALKYVRDQTEKICLEAVRCDGYALQYVRDQTEEICLAAVRESGCALKYIRIIDYPESKKLSVSQISELLGYDVEVIAEKEAKL